MKSLIMAVLIMLPMLARADALSPTASLPPHDLENILNKIAKELKPQPDPHKGMTKVVLYRLVSEHYPDNTALNKDITILLGEGWDLYGFPTMNIDFIYQAVTKTNWIPTKGGK